eukprot:gene12870-biopygen1531
MCRHRQPRRQLGRDKVALCWQSLTAKTGGDTSDKVGAAKAVTDGQL